MPLTPEEFISVPPEALHVTGEYVFDHNPEPAIGVAVREGEENGRRVKEVILVPQFQGIMATGEEVAAKVVVDGQTSEVIRVKEQTDGRQLFFRRGTRLEITGGLEPRFAQYGPNAKCVRIVPPVRS